MNDNDLREFLMRHRMTLEKLAVILGVTEQAVKNWLNGDRPISLTNERLFTMFDRYPQLVKEFDQHEFIRT